MSVTPEEREQMRAVLIACIDQALAAESFTCSAPRETVRLLPTEGDTAVRRTFTGRCRLVLEWGPGGTVIEVDNLAAFTELEAAHA